MDLNKKYKIYLINVVKIKYKHTLLIFLKDQIIKFIIKLRSGYQKI
jgi:hypothetical protein